MKKGKRIIILLLGILGICLFSCAVHAKDADIQEFLGYYLCEMQEVGEYENPEVISLSFNNDGYLQGFKGLFYSTTGTSQYYNYENYYIDQNILVGNYEEMYTYYGVASNVEPGSHEYVLNSDGSLSFQGQTWYRYEKKNSGEEVSEGTLMSVNERDFTEGNYGKNDTFLGIDGLRRKDINYITFLDSLDEEPENSFDVSAGQDGSVKLWTETKKRKLYVYIGAENGVLANEDSANLFRMCTNLKKIDFQNSFYTDNAESFSNMFCKCGKLTEITGIDNWNTSRVHDMSAMFSGCKNLLSINVSGFYTQNVHNYTRMFYECESLEELELENFVFASNCILTGIYDGTKWEGSSPLFENDSYDGITVRNILTFEDVQVADPLLRERIVEAYDAVIDDLRMEGYRENLDETMYALCDLSDDGIPELILAFKNGDDYSLVVYSFNITSYQVEKMYPPFTAWRYIGYSAESQKLCGYDGSSYDILKYENGNIVLDEKLNEMSDKEKAKYDTEIFYYITPYEAWSGHVDLDGDGQEEDIKIYYTDSKSGVAHILITVNDHITYTRKMIGGSQYSSFEIYTFEDKVPLLYINLVTGTGVVDKTIIAQYINGSFIEMLELNDLIDTKQLDIDYGSFTMERKDQAEDVFSFFYELDTINFGNLLLELDYRYTGDEFVQETFFSPIRNTDHSFTLTRNRKIYSKMGSKDTKATLKCGDEIVFLGAWVSDGKLWELVGDKEGNLGWLPGNPDVLCLEAFHPIATDTYKNIKKYKGNFFGLYCPEAEELLELGDDALEAGEDLTAYVYYSQISKKAKCYDEAKRKLSDIEKQISDDCSEYIDEIIGEEGKTYPETIIEPDQEMKKQMEDQKNVLFEMVLGQNRSLEERPEYCEIDLDGNGVEEVIIKLQDMENKVPDYYVYDVYFYDMDYMSYEKSEYSFETKGADRDIRYWEEKNLLLPGGGEFIERGVYKFDGKNLNYVEDTIADLDFLPDLKFEEIHYGDDFIWESRQGVAPVEDIEEWKEILTPMENIIRVHYDMGKLYSSAQEYRTTCESAEQFWEFMHTYICCSGTLKSINVYSSGEIREIAYAAFEDFDGNIPPVPEGNRNVSDNSGIYEFLLATPEEESFELQQCVEEKGEVIATYKVFFYGEESDQICVTMTRNDKANEQACFLLNYTVTKINKAIAESAQEQTVQSSEFIFPDSNSRYLTNADISGLSLQQINYAKNEIFARAGRKFKAQELNDYFGTKSWYNGIYEPDEFDAAMDRLLSQVEIDNANFLAAAEHSINPEGYSLY